MLHARRGIGLVEAIKELFCCFMLGRSTMFRSGFKWVLAVPIAVGAFALIASGTAFGAGGVSGTMVISFF